jgi:hypothetical protein
MSELNQKETKKATTKKGRGGVRAGAGRPKGSRDKVTVQGLLSALDTKSNASYEEILIEDFLAARAESDKNLVLKYHNLLTNKLLATLNSVEIVDTEDQVAAKSAAFAAALSTLQKRGTSSDNL